MHRLTKIAVYGAIGLYNIYGATGLYNIYGAIGLYNTRVLTVVA